MIINMWGDVRKRLAIPGYIPMI